MVALPETDPAAAVRSAEAPPPAVLAEGDPLAPGYRVINHLSRGRYLDVYEVWSEERLCRCVAKVARPDRSDDRSLRAELLREGRLLRRFTHPHLVRAYEVIEAPRPAVILETLTGSTLADLIEHHRRLPLVEVAVLGVQVCSAVHYLHLHGILHLDLKPGNIVSDCGIAKEIDLNIARRPGRRRGVRGTPLYMAPEQVQGRSLTEAADVWGIGSVLFEAATGEAPFERDRETRYPQLARRAASIRSYRRVAAPLAAAIDACLEPEPSARPTLPALSAALRGFLSERGLPA